MKIYNESKTYIVDKDVEAAVSAINAILRKPNPFSDIYKLPDLNDKFREAYAKLVLTEQEPVLETIKEARERVLEELNASHVKQKLSGRVISSFDDISDRATHCNNMATLKNIRHETDALKVRLLNEISAEEEKYLAEQAAKAAAESAKAETPVTPVPVQRKHKTVSIKTLTGRSSWHIESDEDVRRYLSELQQRLEKELGENVIVNVEL